jgi:hypothetical protein
MSSANVAARIVAMSEFGEVLFVEVAVQVIPVLAVLIMADEFTRRDMDHAVHRLWASTAIAVGLTWGIVGEIAGFQALLTGPTENTIPLVDGALMALGATALLPRLAELHLPMYRDAARRFVQKMLPILIGSVGLVFSSLRAPLWLRLPQYVLIGFSVVFLLLVATRDLKASRATESKAEEEAAVPTEQVAMSTVPHSGAVNKEPEAQEPHYRQADNATNSSTATPTRPRWWLVASMAVAAAVGLAMDRRRRRS